MAETTSGTAEPQQNMFEVLGEDWDLKLVRSPSMGEAGQIVGRVANLAARFGGQVKKKLPAHHQKKTLPKAKSRKEVSFAVKGELFVTVELNEDEQVAQEKPAQETIGQEELPHKQGSKNGEPQAERKAKEVREELEGEDEDSEESLSNLPGLQRALSHVYDMKGCPIGSGGFGTVFIATHKHTGQKYAIKKMEKKREGDFQAFKEELEIMKGLDHPHIVRLEDYEEGPSSMRLVLELGQGGELFDLLGRLRKLPEKRTSWICSQVLEAVNYLHNNGICHRDLKLENVLLSNPPTRTSSSRYLADAEDAKEDFVKIIDFGLAKRFAEKKDGENGQFLCNRTRMTDKVGTKEYAAPQVLSHKRKIDPDTGRETSEYEDYSEKCDIFSVGVMLHGMLCGVLPTEDDSTKARMNFVRKVKQYNKIALSENGDYIDPDTGESLVSSKSSKFPFRPAGCAKRLSEEAKDLVIQLLCLEEEDSFVEAQNGEQIAVPGRPDAHAALLLNEKWMLKNGAIDSSSSGDISSTSAAPLSSADQQEQEQQQQQSLSLAKLKRYSEIPDFTKLIIQRMALQLPHEQQKQAKKTFRRLDQNCDGTLSLEEFQDHFNKERNGSSPSREGSRSSCSPEKPSREGSRSSCSPEKDDPNSPTSDESEDGEDWEPGGSDDDDSFDETFRKIDTDRSGALDWTEFLAASEADSLMDNEDLLKRAFFDFDRDGDMKITAGEITKKLRLMGKSISEKEVKNMIAMFDTNGDGEIDFDECKAAIQSALRFPASHSQNREMSQGYP